ncbi:glycoside hydrolase superfamily [Lasiosphaeria miniovina]|uniref:Glycoside hydrolase superfamily n=1 Tax=Lasiosphaeria miniovina TaxID=1954250 RepID=A0AA40DSB4_9PEZI|nr:glycoside hydrolase superfamily [Lasiosphaeria miniovina]KAK0713690.1 glycoside hydrolase superfamily [Lasiosphaeria miniovina]
MSGESMVPEGLEWASADDILDMVASVGWNVIRMGYAIQMVDEIYDNGGADVTLLAAMTAALGAANGTRVTNAIVAKNPIWTAQTTRFKLWSDLARIAAAKRILIHPDVHVSKAQWCCSHTDGNAWFKDANFNTTTWRRGLAYVAAWARNHTNVVSMSLRNELRESYAAPALGYNWQTFVSNMSAGADVIFATNPDLLITWSGMQFSEDVSALTTRKNLLTAPCYKCSAIRDALRREPVFFDLASYPWQNKIVFELHLYAGSEDLDTGTCRLIEAGLYRNGFNALGVAPRPAACNVTADCPPPQRLTPVILSEFGHAQDPTLLTDTLTNCLADFTKRYRAGWMAWSLAGSYRVREGRQGFPDTWGLTNDNWTAWRFPQGVEGFWKPWVKGMNITNPT